MIVKIVLQYRPQVSLIFSSKTEARRHDTQLNDIQHNKTEHKRLIFDTNLANRLVCKTCRGTIDEAKEIFKYNNQVTKLLNFS